MEPVYHRSVVPLGLPRAPHLLHRSCRQSRAPPEVTHCERERFLLVLHPLYGVPHLQVEQGMRQSQGQRAASTPAPAAKAWVVRAKSPVTLFMANAQLFQPQIPLTSLL